MPTLDQLIGIAAIMVAVLIYRLQIQKRTLYFSARTIPHIENLRLMALLNPLRLVADALAVPGNRFLEIRIANLGRLPIMPEDYVQPLTFYFPPTTNLLGVKIVDKRALGAHLVTELSNRSSLVISKTLLNPRDGFSILALIGEGGTEFSISGRIIGISEIPSKVRVDDIVREAAIFLITELLSIVALLPSVWVARTFGGQFHRYLNIEFVLIVVALLLTGVRRFASVVHSN